MRILDSTVCVRMLAMFGFLGELYIVPYSDRAMNILRFAKGSSLLERFRSDQKDRFYVKDGRERGRAAFEGCLFLASVQAVKVRHAESDQSETTPACTTRGRHPEHDPTRKSHNTFGRLSLEVAACQCPPPPTPGFPAMTDGRAELQRSRAFLQTASEIRELPIHATIISHCHLRMEQAREVSI